MKTNPAAKGLNAYEQDKLRSVMLSQKKFFKVQVCYLLCLECMAIKGISFNWFIKTRWHSIVLFSFQHRMRSDRQIRARTDGTFI